MIPDDYVPRTVYIRWRTFLTIVGAVLVCFGTYTWFSRWTSYEITTVEIAQPTSRSVKLQRVLHIHSQFESRGKSMAVHRLKLLTVFLSLDQAQSMPIPVATTTKTLRQFGTRHIQ